MLRHILIDNFLENSAERFPDQEALICGEKRLTYSQIDLMTNSLANALLEEGVKRGDRVAIFMDNSVEAVISIFASLKASAAFVVINHSTKTARLEHILNNCKARILLADESKINTLRNIKCPHLVSIILSGLNNNELSSISFNEIVKNEQDKRIKSKCIDVDLASIIYTSGSTGNPKGVMLSHLNVVSAAHSITTYLQSNEKDIIINMLPLSFDYGLYQILLSFKVGGKIILEKPSCFPYQLFDTMHKERVTGLPGLPAIFSMLFMLKSKFNLNTLRYITNTAMALPASHIRKLKKLFPQAKIYSMYGLTECKRVSFLPPDEIEKRPDSVGKAMPNEEVYIVNDNGEKLGPGEIGELVVRGSNVMLGYWEMPEETSRCLRPGRYPGERVLYTGDLFKMDREGYLYFIGRKDEIIKCRGEKVSPKEIENVLYNLSSVREAAVVGIPDEIWGHSIKAYVVVDNNIEITEEKILNHCSQHLENVKIPKYIELRASLPKIPSGKVDKNQLMMTNINDFIFEKAQKMPDKIAVVQNNRRITYKELNEGIVKLASFLVKKGVKRGDRVAILCDNSPEYIVSYFGSQRAGAISVDINSQYSSNEITKLFDNCHPRVLIVDIKFIKPAVLSLQYISSVMDIIIIESCPLATRKTPKNKDSIPCDIAYTSLNNIISMECNDTNIPQVSGADIASIIYTSGTTGEPKGVMLSHENFVANAKSIIQYLKLGVDDKVMVILPFYYSYGKSLLNTHVMMGGTLVLENSFMYPNVILDKMVEEEVTGFAGVPSTFAILLNRSNIRNYVFRKLRYVTQAGGPMSPKHAMELVDILKDTKIFIMYGQTEATARLTYLAPRDLFRKIGSIGKPIPGVEIEIVKNNGEIAETEEEGEIVARGKNIMVGYWNNPEDTERVLKGNKLYTGDIARMDDEGFLYIVGRRSDMIKSGAHRISPKEIEETILEMQEVHEVVAVGIEDEVLGETIKAIVVLKDGLNLDVRQVIKYCRRKLAQFKIPREVVFVDDLPKTHSGKVRRHMCKELASWTSAAN